MPSMTVTERRIAATFTMYALDYLNAPDRRAMVRAARAKYNEIRADLGLNPGGYMFTKPESQPKTGKSERYTLILHLLPHKMAGVGNLCPSSTRGCRANCLEHSGHGVMDSVKAGRLARTVFMHTYPGSAAVLITHEITLALARHQDVGVRMNGTSDLRWELITPEWLRMMGYEGVTFYDYTKFSPHLRMADYHLTYSAHEDRTPAEWAQMCLDGFNVAAVVRHPPHLIPSVVNLGGIEVPTLNGDLSDDRTQDKPGHLVLLYPKGPRIWSDLSGFTFDYNPDCNMLTPHVA